MTIKLAISDSELIVGWLYPNSFGIPNPPDNSIVLEKQALKGLVSLNNVLSESKDASRAIVEEYTDCDVGVPHDAPDYIDRLSCSFIDSLSSIPNYERWRFSEMWAKDYLGKNPSNQEKTIYKEMLNKICDLAIEAKEKGLFIIVL